VATAHRKDGKLADITDPGNRVGEGDWRSSVILIGTGDARHPITYHRAGGGNPDFAQQLWR